MASRSAIACSSTVPVGLDLPECGRRQVDRRVERQRGELLALGVGYRLGLALGELTQAAQQVLGISTERKPEAAAAFHAVSLAQACNWPRPRP